jgi:hypothetical protein
MVSLLLPEIFLWTLVVWLCEVLLPDQIKAAKTAVLLPRQDDLVEGPPSFHDQWMDWTPRGLFGRRMRGRKAKGGISDIGISCNIRGHFPTTTFSAHGTHTKLESESR